MKKRESVYLKPALYSLLILGALAGFYFYSQPATEKALSQANANKYSYPTLYSDKHITENAILADARFSEKYKVSNDAYIANVFSAILKKKNTPTSDTPERGTWLWTPIPYLTPAYRESIISGAKKNGVRSIYLSIDSYLDIYTLPEGAEKDARKKSFDEMVESFVKEAREAGLHVDAVAGWRNWAEKGHEYKAFAVLEYAMEYNRTHEEKLRGFQYDIEPYLLDYYEQNKKVVLRNFVNLINEAVARLEDSDLEFSVAIPEFYDNGNLETPKFLYGFKYAYTLDHLLTALKYRPNSKLIVMAYRNTALGENGSVDISKDEISLASKYNTKVVVAQETGETPLPSATFLGTSRAHYDEQTKIIDTSFAKEKAYGGLATHYINTFLSLK